MEEKNATLQYVAVFLHRTAKDKVRAALEDGTLHVHFNVANCRQEGLENQEEKNATHACNSRCALVIEMHQLSSMKGLPRFFSSKCSAQV